QIHPVQIIATLGLIPALTYYLSWLPYLQLTPDISFLQWQARIIDYHHRVGGMDAHPYCSPWYSWIFMLRPVAYFYKTSHGMNEPAPIVGPPLPVAAERTIYDVHAMGNPVLWWFSILAIALLTALLIARASVWLRQRPIGLDDVYTWAAFFLVVNWLANLLPWVSVTRCVFIYHYMESVLYSFVALALVIDRWLFSLRDWQRIIGLTAVFLILIAFVFWLPMFLGLPMTPEAVQSRRWLQSWI
ncbi:MAG: dolichyl-phosphate-mannose--protein O-mannosyl transferase, partial [Microcoleus sp. SIO2G3]|nr:dolichyl-phosphate-mannose--protein O-mannosyl transferase [Microcoleus sp. SIO2G3]